MATVHDLLEANLRRVFGNRDAAARRIAIDEIYSDDIAFTDPDSTVVGRNALEERAAGLLANAPAEFVFAEDGPRYVDGDTGALAWAFGPAGAPVARGIDIVDVRDGQIVGLRTILAED